MPWFSLFMRLMLFVFAEDASRICQRVLPAGCYPPVNKTLVPLFGTRVWFVARVMLFVFEEDTSRNCQRVLPAVKLPARAPCRVLPTYAAASSVSASAVVSPSTTSPSTTSPSAASPSATSPSTGVSSISGTSRMIPQCEL